MEASWWLVSFLALGSVTGFLAGLLGIGGGILLVPLTTLILSHHNFPLQYVVKSAIATSIATIAFTAISSIRVHSQRHSVRWDIAKALTPGLLLGSFLGSQASSLLSGRVLSLIFSAFSGITAAQMYFGNSQTARAPSLSLNQRTLGLLGVMIGAISAMVGAGGGFLTVPLLEKKFGVKMQEAVGTGSACGIPVALASLIGYVVAGWSLPMPPSSLGYVYTPALGLIVCTAVFTAPWGAKTAQRLSPAQLKKAFAFILVLTSSYMAWQGLHGT